MNEDERNHLLNVENDENAWLQDDSPFVEQKETVFDTFVNILAIMAIIYIFLRVVEGL